MTSPNQELISYFKTNLATGYSREALHTAAKSIGWSEELIVSAWQAIDSEQAGNTQTLSASPIIPETTPPLTSVSSLNTETPYRTGESFVYTPPTSAAYVEPTPVISPTPVYKTNTSLPYSSFGQSEATAFPVKKKGVGSILIKVVLGFILLAAIGIAALFFVPINPASPISTLQSSIVEKVQPLITFVKSKVPNRAQQDTKESIPLSNTLDTNQDFISISKALENLVANPQRTASTIGTFAVEFPAEAANPTSIAPSAPTSTPDVAEFILKSTRINDADPTVWTNFLMKSKEATEADLAWYHTSTSTLMKVATLSMLEDVLTPENAPKDGEWFRVTNPDSDLQFIEIFGFPVDLARMYLHRSTTETLRPFIRTLMNDTSVSISKKADPLSSDTDIYHVAVAIPLFTEHIVKLLKTEPSWDPSHEADIRLWLNQFSELSFDLTIARATQTLISATHRIVLTNATNTPIRIDAVTTFDNLDAIDVLPAQPTPSVRSITDFMEGILGKPASSTDQTVPTANTAS